MALGLVTGACGGGSAAPDGARGDDMQAPSDLGTDETSPADADVGTRDEAGADAGVVVADASPPVAGSDAGHEAPPVAADLAGAWTAVVPAPDGGVAPERRLRFFDGRYTMVLGLRGAYCGEGGTFSISNAVVTFQPDATAALGGCPAGTVRTEAVQWMDDGIVFQIVTTAGATTPLLHRRARTVAKVFATIETHDGNWAGDAALPGATILEKADEFCARSLARPDGQSYKAMMTDGKTRTGNPAVAWILKPNTTYFQADGVLNVFRTDPMALSSWANHSILNNANISYFWSGLNFGFGADPLNCNGWTSTSDTVYARVADASQALFTFTSSVSTGCGALSKNGLICISQ